MKLLRQVLILVFVLTVVSHGQDFEQDRNELLAGVKRIGAKKGGTVSQWLVCGKSGFAVAHDGTGAPIVAAAKLGKGRIVFLPGRTWLPSMDNAGIGDMAKLYGNILKWCGAGQSGKVLTNASEAAPWLEKQGLTPIKSKNTKALRQGLEEARFAVLGISYTNITAWPDVVAFVSKGGSAVISADFRKLEHRQKFNDAVHATGVYCSTGRTRLKDVRGWEKKGYIGAYKSTDAANLANFGKNRNLDAKAQKELAMAIGLLGGAPGCERIQEKFYAKIKPRLSAIKPSLENPVTDPLEKALLLFEGGHIQNVPALQRIPHRTALPVGKAPRVERVVTIAKVQKQVDTGLYALPGVPIRVSVPSALVGSKASLKISHLRTDIKDKEYLMVPHQIFMKEIDSTTLELVSPYGGLVMLTFPKDVELNAPFKVKVGNAVEAPRFTLGKTTDAEWIKHIRNRPTPFGILECDNVIFISHSSWLRKLDDPTRVLELWNEMIRLIDEYYNYTGNILRVHHDFQPVGGFSSFPQSYPVRSGEGLFSYRMLITGGAPLTIHEHGHHGGKAFMNFEGMGEATANMGGLYALGKGMTYEWKGSHKALDRIGTFRSLPTDKNMWKTGSHSFNQQRYSTFSTLGHAFGWDAYRDVVHRLKEANNHGGKENQLVTDNWLRFYSEEVGHDLSDYFEKWHLSFSPEAKTDVAKYPKWQLIELVEDRIVCKAGQPINIHWPHLNDFSLDETLKPGRIFKPHNGILEPIDNKLITYRPNDGFKGTDSFSYEVSNAFGNSYTGTVQINILNEKDYPKLEFGTVKSLSDSWTKIKPQQTYASPVLAFFPLRFNEPAQSAIDARQLSDGSFELKGSAMVNYMIVEEGCYTEDQNGIKMEAVKTKLAAGETLTQPMDYRQKLTDFYRDPITFGSVVNGQGQRFLSAHPRGAYIQVGACPAGSAATIHHVTLDSFSCVQLGSHQILTDRAALDADAKLQSPFSIDRAFIVDHTVGKKGDITLFAASGSRGALKTSNEPFPPPEKKKKPKAFKTNVMLVHDIPQS